MGKNNLINLVGVVLLSAACSFIEIELLPSIGDQGDSSTATDNANNTQISILEKTKAASLENQPPPDDKNHELTTTKEVTKSQAPSVTAIPSSTNPPTETPVDNIKIRAMENMFCRDGPGRYYEAHTTILARQVVPVVAQWHDNDW